MRLALFGATGRTGRLVVERALAAGHELIALARAPERLAPAERLTVVVGDATDPSAVAQTVDEADAIVSTLGHARGSPPDLLQTWARRCVQAMRKRGVRRVVVLTGAAVRAPGDQPSLPHRAARALVRLLAPTVLRDSEEMVAILRSSGLDWTIVRAPRLTDGSLTGRWSAGPLRSGGFRATRADVAAFMVEEAAASRWLHQLPVVTSPGGRR